MNNDHESQPRIKPLQQKQHDDILTKISKLDELNRDDQKHINQTELEIAVLLNSSHTENTDSKLDSYFENILKTEKEILKRNTQKEELNERLADITSDIKNGPEISPSTHKPKI